MAHDNDILKQVDRRSGMTVPDGYFDGFASRMMERLPEKKQENILPRTWWQRCRPYVYMAAMFGGIWLMMWIFNDISGRQSNHMNDNPVIATVLQSDDFYDYYMVDEFNEYDVIEGMYDDGVTLANFK